MKALLEFLPLVAFLVAFKLGDIYTATATLMVAMPLMLFALWLISRKVPTLPLISTILVLVFGVLTLALGDPRFIQWKPTIFLWGLALFLLVGGLVRREPLLRGTFAVLAEGHVVTDAQWRSLSWAWVLFAASLGAVNLIIARTASEQVWANFKVFGITAALFVFLAAQTVWLQRRPAAPSAAPPPP